jgi:peptidyl-prolyl cis-trans isomerase SurA
MKFTCLAALALASLCLAADDVSVVDQVVARVNGDIVSEDELQRFTRELMSELKQQNATPQQIQQEFDKRRKDILRDRIDELLLIQKGKELNINVDSDVSKYMANLQRQSGLTDTDKFHEYVRQQSGMSYEDFLTETKNQFLTREVVGEEVGRHINISPKEIEDYYNAHKQDFVREDKVYISEILISAEGKDAAGIAAAEKKAKQIAEEAKHGERHRFGARQFGCDYRQGRRRVGWL